MTELCGNFIFLFVWSVFLTTVVAEEVLPPENVRLSWSEDLYPELTWTPPKDSHHCSYRIISTMIQDGIDSPLTWPKHTSLRWRDLRCLNGGYVNISIETVCNGRSSKAQFYGLNDPDMKLDCVLLSSSVHCFWDPPPSVQLQLFYSVPVSSRSQEFTELRECLHYSERRNSCDIPVKTQKWTLDLLEPINLLLNGTQGSRTVRNIHQILDIRSVHMKWKVTESEKQFLIDWTPLGYNKDWTYHVSHTADCNTTITSESVTLKEPPYVLERQASCSYDISMRGETAFGETEWTEKHFDVYHEPTAPVIQPNAPVIPVWPLVLIPIVLAVLVVLILSWWRRNKEKIWPKIPQPNAKLINDLLNNNIKANFYLPTVQEECDVTLVIDPKPPEL